MPGDAQPGQRHGAPGGPEARGPRSPAREVNGNVAPGQGAAAGQGTGQGAGAKKRRRRGRGGGGGGGGSGGAKGPGTQKWVGLPRDEEESV